MKIKNIKSGEYVEADGVTHKVRSEERIDVRPGETRKVKTGLEILANKDENVKIRGSHVVGETFYGRSYKEIEVTIFNTSDSNIEIFPGDTIAMLTFVPTAKFVGKATFREGSNAE